MIYNLLTSAVSKQFLLLLLTGKSLLGKAPFAELAPVPTSTTASKFGFFSERGSWRFLMAGRICRAGMRINGELLIDANRSHKRPRKTWDPRRLCLHEPARQPRTSTFSGNLKATEDLAPRDDTMPLSPWKTLKMQQVKLNVSACPCWIGIRAIIKAEKSFSASYWAVTGFICI